MALLYFDSWYRRRLQSVVIIVGKQANQWEKASVMRMQDLIFSRINCVKESIGKLQITTADVYLFLSDRLRSLCDLLIERAISQFN